MTFRVGQEVAFVCSSDKYFDWNRSGEATSCCLDCRSTYIISDIENDEGVCWLKLVGWGADQWDADMFRPIVKTDISIFTAMLAPAPKQTVNA